MEANILHFYTSTLHLYTSEKYGFPWFPKDILAKRAIKVGIKLSQLYWYKEYFLSIKVCIVLDSEQPSQAVLAVATEQVLCCLALS